MAETVRKNLGMVTAYAYAVSKGYTGTEEEFAELMASYADVAQDAEASAQAAAQSATTAEQKATQAAGSATNAAVSATSASESAQAAAGSSNSASLYAQNASASATNAAGSASSASTYAGNASASAQAAEGSANAAQASATQAAGSADDAEAAKDTILGMNAVAETLPAGSQATASYSNGTLTLGIPKGDTGEKGDPGDTNDAPLIYSSASGSVANFTDGADNLPLKSCVVNMEPIQEGEGDPSPENVRSISGRTGAKVTRTGFNVWNEEWEDGTYINGVKNVSNNVCCKNLIPVCPNSTYYFKFPTGNTFYMSCFDRNGNVLHLTGQDTSDRFQLTSNGIYTTTADTYYLVFTMSGSYGTAYNNDISINYPSTDTEYHPYKGTTYSVNWETEAGTVYGGYVDVVSGKLTVDKGIYTITGSEEWTSWQGIWFARVLNNPSVPAPGLVNCISDKLVGKSRGDLISSKSGVATYGTGLYLGDTEYNTLSEYTGAQIVYTLETPTEIQLTPQEVRTLLGENNIWSDGGDMEVEYPADTKMYIDTKIAEAVAAAMA